MVLCIIALPIFAILGIFSLKYRKLTAEALDCLFRTATLRKCRSGLDDKIKSAMTGKAMKFSPKLARLIYRNYKLISWIILIILMWSLYGTSVGIYNYYLYGNCNGPDKTGFCALDPTGKNSKISEIGVDVQSEILYPVFELNDPVIGNKSAVLTIIEFGCYACPYTKKAEPVVKEVLDYYKGKVSLQFKTFSIPHHNASHISALASDCALEQNAYPQFHKLAFEQQDTLTKSNFTSIAKQLNLNASKFAECVLSEKYKPEVDADTLMGVNAGVTGTPTFFVNRQKIVGPKPFRTFKTVIDGELGE